MRKIDIYYNTDKSVRAKIVLWLLEMGIPIHAKLNKDRKAWNLKSIDFLNFTKQSLGNELGQFYKNNRFEPIPKAERHDVFHVLLGYTTNVIDEAAMQFFLLGNGKPSFFTTGTCIITLLLFPNKLSYFMAAYKKGKSCTCIKDWDFKLLLNTNINVLKNQIFK